MLRQIRMPLVHFFETSFSRTYERDILLVEVVSEGVPAGAKSLQASIPFITKNGRMRAWLMLKNYIAPRVLGQSSKLPRSVSVNEAYPRPQHGARRIRSRRCGIWRRGRRDCRCIGTSAAARGTEIPCGVSIGVQDTVDQLLQRSKLNCKRAISGSR